MTIPKGREGLPIPLCYADLFLDSGLWICGSGFHTAMGGREALCKVDPLHVGIMSHYDCSRLASYLVNAANAYPDLYDIARLISKVSRLGHVMTQQVAVTEDSPLARKATDAVKAWGWKL